LRAFVRAHETSLVILAALVGVAGGLVVAAMSAAVELLHVVLFDLDNGQRLSSQLRIEPLRALLVPTLGGFLLGLAFLIIARWRPAREVDPVERRRSVGWSRGRVHATVQRACRLAWPRISSASR
jgi:CIC family chloride channel protein